MRVFCLARSERGEGVDLATVGANARRASEDSTAVGYLERPGTAARFSRSILKEAGIATVEAESGRVAMGRLLNAIAAADTGSLRESVRDSLDG